MKNVWYLLEGGKSTTEKLNWPCEDKDLPILISFEDKEHSGIEVELMLGISTRLNTLAVKNPFNALKPPPLLCTREIARTFWIELARESFSIVPPEIAKEMIQFAKESKEEIQKLNQECMDEERWAEEYEDEEKRKEEEWGAEMELYDHPPWENVWEPFSDDPPEDLDDDISS